ncbi:MAG TPA: family 1 encapsulin nanocompartment shell protein [Candidatus Methylomirabilis sp.]|nr:family 1 encapsulin nanocompartment shell protein [Candidatus Methylomirabilis sp.]
MNNLKRELAPISSGAWKEIDAEARRVLKLKLAGRKLVDFEGPLGSSAAAVNTGRIEALRAGPVPDVDAGRRQALPLIELRSYFDLSRQEMDTVERGGKDPELQPLIDAATRIAYAEDTAVFHGYAAGGIQGIDEASAHPTLPIPDDYQAYPQSIAEATRLLRLAGVDGPYAIALGPRYYTGLTQAVGDGGYPVLNVVRKLVDGPLVWAPAVKGAVVLSLRGGDFELTVGRDLSIGYHAHNETSIRLYLVESMTFRVITPEAAVALAHKDEKTRKAR